MSLDRPPAWLAPLERLEAKLRSKPSVSDATVVSVDPIRVQLDGKPSPVAPSPSTVVPVAVGDRVWVMHHGKTRLRIIGVIGGGRVPYAQAANLHAVPGDGTNQAVRQVDFPAGRFSLAPSVTLSVRATPFYFAFASNITTEGFEIGVQRYDGADFTFTNTVMWQAIQMTPTSAGG